MVLILIKCSGKNQLWSNKTGYINKLHVNMSDTFHIPLCTTIKKTPHFIQTGSNAESSWC